LAALAFAFDTELLSKIIVELKPGEAPDTNGLTAEHLLQAQPILQVILGKLSQLILLCKQVPAGFGHSYIIPVPKPKDCITKALTCEDFRGIVISPIISKLFEYYLKKKFTEFLQTNNNQFGFKKAFDTDM